VFDFRSRLVSILCMGDNQTVTVFWGGMMAKIRIQTTHKQQVAEVLRCNGGVQILNDGTVCVMLPTSLARKLGFKGEYEK